MADKRSIYGGIELDIDERTDPGERPEAVFILKNKDRASWSLAKIVGIGDGDFGGKLAFETNAGGEGPTEKTVERMTIDRLGHVHFNGSLTVGDTPNAGKTTGDLTANGNITAGNLAIGPWPHHSGYVFFGSNNLDQENAENYALLQNSSKTGAQSGQTFLNSPLDISFRIKNIDKMILDNAGNVKIFGSLTVDKQIKQEDWKDALLANGWQRYNTIYNTAGYFKDSMGIVHLRGLVKGGTIAEKKPIFTLPEGYRPNLRELHVVCTWNNASGRVDIDPKGQVLAVAGNKNWISLYGITFRAAR